MTDFTVVIPARHASTRLPGKMLADIGGKPMVVRVAERARASGAAEVIVATDHADIADAVTRHGFTAVLTRDDHASGTDRIAEVAAQRRYAPQDIVVNVQGDEPLIDPALIRGVARQLADHADAAIATLCCPIDDAAEFTNPNVVKVVLDASGYALYFSRAPIPYARDAFAQGISSAPRAACRFTATSASMPTAPRFSRATRELAPAPLEQFEALEQLRALWHGHRISVAITTAAPHAGVDTAEDLARVQALVRGAR